MEKLPTSPPPSTFPSDVLKWMKKNAGPKMALKLMQICKYFQYQEFPYFVIFSLHEGWGYQTAYGIPFKKIDIETIKKKLWITQNLNLAINENFVTTLLPMIAVCDIKNLDLSHQNITFDQFKILTADGNVTEICLCRTVIKDDKTEKGVPLEDLFKCMPKLKSLKILSYANTIHSHQQATKFLPQNLQSFYLRYVTEEFAIEECVKFILDNQKIKFTLSINNENSAMYVQKYQTLVDNLIEKWTPGYRVPKISFVGQGNESKNKLIELGKEYQRFINDV